MKPSHKTVLLWIAVFLIAISVYNLINPQLDTLQAIKYYDFHNAVKEGKIKSVTIRGRNIDGELNDGNKFKTKALEPDSDFKNFLIDNDVLVTFEDELGAPWWQQFLISWLPMIFLFLLFFFFMRQLQIGGGKAMSFGKSKARLMSESQVKVTFNDVAGIDEAKDELQEIIDFLKDPKKFTRLGGRIPKGVLLMGAPGTGKTLLAKAIAGEAGVPFFSISGSDFVEMFVGVGASRVRDLFEQGKRNAPCIIFIDEIDAVGRHRGAGVGGGHDEREQTLNQLLVEMDGFESNDGVIIIAATNRPDVLDPALLRPGRFDRRVVVPTPDLKGREGILKVHSRKTPLSPDVDVEVIARGTPGFSGADLENLVNEAALIAARDNKDALFMTDFEVAKDKILMGKERRSMILSDEQKRTTAYHEAGHTLVALTLPGSDPIHKVSVIPRGMALGVTQQLPKEDRYTISKDKAEIDITVLMGGRIAEETMLSQKTSGAGNDIERATEIARRMVCDWGMSKKLGPLTFGKREEQIFLGKELGMHKDYSESTAMLIDEEIKRIVGEAYTRARKIITENKAKLEAIAQALLEYETLDSKEIEMIITGTNLEALRIKKEEEKRLMRAREEARRAQAKVVAQEKKPKQKIKLVGEEKI